MKTCKYDDVVGKRIVGIVVTEGSSPMSQVFIEFGDGTYFELYSHGRIQPSKLGVGGREAVRSYLGLRHRIVYETDPATEG